MSDRRGASTPPSAAVDEPSIPPADTGGETTLPAATQAVIDAFTSIAADLDTPKVLRRVVEAACDLTGSRGAALGVLGSDGTLADTVAHGESGHDTAAGLLSRLDEPPGQATVTSDGVLVVPILVRGSPYGHLCLADKQAGSYGRHDELLIQSLVDVAALVIENARAFGLSERRRRWLEVFGELTELLQPPITLETALQRIAVAVRRAAHAESASVIQVPEAGEPFAAAVDGATPPMAPPTRTRLDMAVREVVRSAEVLEVPLDDGVVAVLAALKAHLTLPGVLILTHRPLDRAREAEERELLASFAHQAALALDRTQALEDREEMAVIADRDRIARDLHDVVIQRLFATGLHLQSLRAAAPTPELTERIDQSVKDLDQTIRDIRGTIFDLQTRPRKSLRIEVRDLVRESQSLLGHSPTVHLEGPVDSPVDRDVQQQLVAVLREALANVAEHAEAPSSSVALRVSDRRLELVVADTGRGLPANRRDRGLRNMRRRAAMLGGRLVLSGNEPTGTVLTWSVPLDRTPGGS